MASSETIVIVGGRDSAELGTRIKFILAEKGFQRLYVASLPAAEDALRSGTTSLLLILETIPDVDLGRISHLAASRQVPVLAVKSTGLETGREIESLALVDDWVSRESISVELIPRIARLLHRRSGLKAADAKNSRLTIDSDFFSLVVHDLRTPLNVIYLTMLMIRQTAPTDDPQFEQDLQLIEDNFRQLERMLTILTDYYRLFEETYPVTPHSSSPKNLIDEILEQRAIKAGVKAGPVVVELLPSCPPVVTIDQTKAWMAISYAIGNAAAAAAGHPIRLILRGQEDRFMIEIAIDVPAPNSVHSVELSAKAFERLCGFAAERRGMDLAIAAKVSELFGGSARLEVRENRGTSVVLDWPARLAFD